MRRMRGKGGPPFFSSVMGAPVLAVRDVIVAQRSTPGPLCAVVPRFLVINGPQTIGITQLCYSIHFRTSNNGQAATIWHNWAPFLTNAVYCLLMSAVKMAFAHNSLFYRYEYSSWLLIRLEENRSIIKNSSGSTDSAPRKRGHGIEGDKVPAASSSLSLPGAEKRTWRPWAGSGISILPLPALTWSPSNPAGLEVSRNEGRGGHFQMLTLALTFITSIFCYNFFLSTIR